MCFQSGSTMDTFGILLMIYVGCSIHVPRSLARADNEYCIRETFNVTCDLDEVIMMTSARYGRMRAGRCIGVEYGFVGCYTDVLPQMDQACSGRRNCEYNIRLLMDIAQPCPRDLTSYLEATYTCMKVAKANEQACLRDGYIVIQEETGYIASTGVTTNGPGSRMCPWRIMYDSTQNVKLTLFDFDKPIEPFDTETHCSLYAVIEEDTHTRELSLCQYGVRNKHLYTSTTNGVSLYFINNEIQRHFMLKYEAVGCPKLSAPGAAWATQDAMTATVKCNGTDETWYLTCKGNRWMGDPGNCTKGGVPWRAQQVYDPEAAFPYGILLAVVIGIVVGAVIGSILLGFVYMCFRKQMSPSSARERYPNDPPEMTLALRVGDDGKSVYPSLVKPRSQHPGDYTYDYGRPYPPGIRPTGGTCLQKPLSPDRQGPSPLLSQSSEGSDHIYESANFERCRAHHNELSPTVYYELESEGFIFPFDVRERAK